MKAKNYIFEKLTQLMAARGLALPAKTTIEAPKSEQHGDMATNIAMVMPKEKGQNPRALAEEIKAELLAACPEIESIEIAGPGFINFTFKPVFWQSVALAALDNSADFGRINVGQGRKVQVEYVSANPTGPLHIGHGRGAAVGDSLTRILRFTGHEVETEYYLNDAGRQMRLLGLAVWVRYQQACGIEIEFPEDCYRGDYIKDISAALLAEKGKALLDLPEHEALDLCYERGMTDILNGIKQDLIDFRVEHQHWFSEKSLYERDLVPAAMETLKERDFAFENEGALWFKATDFTDEKDRVLIRSNGVPTYFASDITYHKEKFDRGFDRVIDIWGADHHGYVPRMKAGVEALGRSPDDLQVLLIQFVNLLRDGTQVAMSTRSGQFVTLRDVMTEVGVDATRYFFVMRRSDSHLDFDLELAKAASTENPVYYVQYAHARICSVLREAESRKIAIPNPEEVRPEIYESDEERKLISRLAAFPDEMEKASKELAPHMLVNYVSDLAGEFHSFYNAKRVLGEEEPVLKARLLLVQAAGTVLSTALALLGVNAPERM